MNFGSCLLAVLALGALSVDSAAAGHRSRGVHSAALHHHSRAALRNVATSRTSTGTQRDSSSEIKSVVPDQSKGGTAKDGSRLTGIDKGNGDDESLHTRKSGKTGVSTLGPGVRGKEDADIAIDTRITVNQGRETIKSLKKRQFKSSNVNVTAMGFKHQHIANRHQDSPIRSPGDQRRNAIGTAVEHDKTVEHRNAAGAAVIPTTTTAGLEPKANSVPPATGTTVHDPNPVSSTGKAPINTSPSGATQGNHGYGTAAMTIATTNGPSLNGTGMIRPSSRTAAIGGPAKVAPGVLSGNSFRPRYP